MSEQHLQELFTTVQTLMKEVSQLKKGSLEWEKVTKHLRKALDQLLLEIQKLPGLAKCSHPDYPEVLDDTLIEVANRISEFHPQHDSITTSLIVWINHKLRLKYKVRDLYSRGKQPPPLSLDQLLSDEGSTTFGDIFLLPDTLPEPESSIAHCLWEYIDQDTEGKLQNCIPQKYPNCNAQKVARMLLSGSYYKKNGQPNLRVLAQAYDIPYKTFYSYWRDHCQPLLLAIANKLVQLGVSEPTIRTGKNSLAYSPRKR